jgi:hypothetical protein
MWNFGLLPSIALAGALASAPIDKTRVTPPIVEQSTSTPGAGVRPCRFGSSRDIQRHLDELWAGSPTFQRQCERLQREKTVVSMVVVPRFDSNAYRARTEIMLTTDGIRIARVQLGLSGNIRELIVHELEHVLEQSDGWDLAKMAAQNHGAWKVTGAMFETERADRAGKTAASEVAAWMRAERARRAAKPANVALAATQ